MTVYEFLNSGFTINCNIRIVNFNEKEYNVLYYGLVDDILEDIDQEEILNREIRILNATNNEEIGSPLYESIIEIIVKE